MKKKIYKIKPEFISATQDPELYDLERKITAAIHKVREYREKKYNEHPWQEALPQTFAMILDGWDKNAIKIAVEFWLNGMKEEITLEVKE